jgi:hypothetical protein
VEAPVGVAGWVVYVVVALFALSGLLGIARAASSGGSVTRMGLCQWALAVAGLIAFGITDWNKLHLLWVMPAGFLISFTPIGLAVGYVVGIITAIVFGGRGGRPPGNG